MKVGLLLIATAKYHRFVSPFLESARQYFMPSEDVTFFCFTDRPVSGVTCIPIKHEPWPAVTLNRYRYFCAARQELEAVDYLFYCDVDMLFVDVVGPDILSDITVVSHPGYFATPRVGLPYETNPRSRAYIKPDEGGKYFAGGFNGGATQSFLKLSEGIVEATDADTANGVTAVWHDESHLNRYMIDHPPTKILTPEYAHYAPLCQAFHPRILCLSKDNHEIRSE